MRHAGAAFLSTLCALALCQPVFAQPAGSGAVEVEQALAAIRPQAIRAHMGLLADDLLEGRRTGTRGYDLAAKYVRAQFEALGLAPAGTNDSYFQPVPLVRMTTVEPECSLAFLCDGRKTALRYGVDYFTGSVTQDSNVTGAYDNASGVAILLEVANAFAHLPAAPRRSVLFLAVTGEEEGLNGSDFFARHSTVPIGRIVANVNLDMFLMLYPFRDVIAFGAEHSSLALPVEEAARRLGIAVSPDPFPEQVIFIRSDHYSFVQQGVPALFLTGGFQTGDPAIDGRAIWSKWIKEVLHQPGDDMSQVIDFGAGAQFGKLNFLITYLVTQNDKAPTWNPGDFFGEKFRRAR